METKSFKAIVEYPTITSYEVSAANKEEALEKAIALDRNDDGYSTFTVDFGATPIIFVEDEQGNVVVQSRPSYFDLVRLAQNIVDHIAATENTSGQVEKLRELGFSDELLAHFGYKVATNNPQACLWAESRLLKHNSCK